MRRWSAFLVGMVLFTVILGAGALEAAGKGRLLVAPQLLDTAGLTLDWQVHLAVSEVEIVEKMLVFDEYLIVLTDHNYLFCIDREKGSIYFEFQLVPAGLPVYPPQYYGGKFWFVVGNELLVVNPHAATAPKPRKLSVVGSGATSAAMRNTSHLYIAGSDRRVHALVTDGYWQRFSASAENNSLINSLVCDDKFVAFATDAGNVVCMSPSEPKEYWQRDLVDRIDAPIVRDGNWLYVSVESGKIHKLSITTGIDGWKEQFQAAAALVDSAVTGKKVIYQYAGVKGFYAVDKKSGAALWQLENGIGLLAENGTSSYVFAKPGMLIRMDNAEAKKIYSVNLAGVAKFASNTVDSKMYISSDKGKVMAVGIKAEK
jgi:outer membrane protein assembly factor BamB